MTVTLRPFLGVGPQGTSEPGDHLIRGGETGPGRGHDRPKVVGGAGPRPLVQGSVLLWYGHSLLPTCPRAAGDRACPCGHNCCTCAGLGGQSVRLFRPLKPHSVPGKGEWR